MIHLNSLFSFGARVSSHTPSFLQTIYSSDITAITSFLKLSTKIDEKDLNTAIEYSVFENKEHIFKILLGYKTALDFKSLQKQTQEFPHFYLVSLLPRVNYFSEKNKNNITLPTHKAAFEGNLKKLQTCTKQQLNDPDTSTLSPTFAILTRAQGMTPLHYAALGGHLDVVKLLESTGISLHTKDSEGHSILHFAALSRSKELLKYLIQKAPSLLHLENSMGETPMHFAATQKDYGVIKYLIESGADPLKRDLKGVAPLAILWKMIENRDPLNINLLELIPSILLLGRLLISSYQPFNSRVDPFTAEFQKHLTLMSFDRYSLLTNICMFFWNISGLDSSGIAIQPLTIYEATCGSIPAFKNLKACWNNRYSRDIRKITASALVNTVSLIQTISAIYRTVTLFHLRALIEIKNRRDEEFVKEFYKQYENFRQTWENTWNANTGSSTRNINIIKTHMELTSNDLKTICSDEDPFKSLNREFRKWALKNHPDKKPGIDDNIFKLVSDAFYNLKALDTSPSSIKEGGLCSNYL